MTRKRRSRTQGTGSVYQEGGRWRAQLIIDGRTVKRWAASRREALAKLRELAATRDADLDLAGSKYTVKTWCAFWLETLLPAKQTKLHTISGHRQTCSYYIYPYLGEQLLTTLKANHIDAWQQKLRSTGLSEGTIANARRRLSAALEAARKRRIIVENVVLLTDAPAATAKQACLLDTAQVRSLLSDLRGHRLYALYLLAVTLGMRQAELMGLRWSSLNLADGHLVVKEQLQRVEVDGHLVLHRERPKTEAGKREIPLCPEQISVLAAHQLAQQREREHLGDAWRGEDLVFVNEDGAPLERGALLRQFKRALKRAGLPVVSFHSLRHTAGSIMLSNGAQMTAVSNILGHSSPAVTAKIYAHSFEEGRRQAVAAAVAAIITRSE